MYVSLNERMNGHGLLRLHHGHSVSLSKGYYSSPKDTVLLILGKVKDSVIIHLIA